jgi:predicted small secreted protein
MDNKKQIILAILAVLAIALIAGCTTTSGKTVKTGDNVTVDYIGTLDNGSIFDTSNMTVAMQAGIYDPDAIY